MIDHLRSFKSKEVVMARKFMKQAVGAGVLGFILANHYDFPPAQMTVALLCLSLCLAWLWRRFGSELKSSP